MALTEIKTSGIADDAVTTDKLANAINTARDANTAKASITINNNADNRVITGSGTANTLNGESSVVIDSIGQVSVGGSTTAFDTTGSLNGLQGYYETDSGIATIGSYSSGGSTLLNFHTNSGGGASAERMRIDSSGNVGIGTTAPLKTLTTKAGSNTHAFYIAADNDATDGWGFHADSSSGALKIDRSIDNNFGYRRATFHQDGGLCFGSDTAAANALDDYEEGTWTPTVSEGSVSSTNAKYTKIGNIVYLQAYLYSFSQTTSSSALAIGGLPYNTTNGGQAGGAAMYAYIDSDNRFIIYVNSNNTLLFYGVYSGNYSQMTYSQLQGGSSNIHIFATYMA